MNRESLLTRLTIRLTYIADGTDPEVNSLLGQLRDSVRQGDDEKKLAELSEQLERLICIKEDASQASDNQNLLGDYALEFSKSIKSIKVDKTHRSQLTKLADQLVGAVELDHQLQAMKEIFTLINNAVNNSISKKSSSGVKSWFSKNDDKAWQAFLDKSAQLLNQVLKHVDTLKGNVTHTKSLKEQLEESSEVDQVEDVLIDVIELLKEITDQVGEERVTTQNFLGDIREKLLNVEETIFSIIADDESSFDRAKMLEQQVSDDVSVISKSVEEDDLNKLKETVEAGLVNLSKRVKGYLDTERDQRDKSDVKFKKLVRKVSEMESETIDLRGLLKRKQDLAVKDPLTGVYNRAGYDERIVEEFARQKRINSALSVVFVDCNKFKAINDTYGHSAGDAVLVKVAEVLSKRARASDIIARYGGDEFVVLLPNTAIDGAEIFAKDACARVESAGFNDNGKPLGVSISCGVTQVREDDTQQSVLHRADEAMYKAKNTSSKVFSVS